MADSSCTRDERRERIVAECNSVRQALQDLLTEYMSNAGHRPTEQLDRALAHMTKKTRDLRRQLRKAVVDHVSDSFLDASGPLILLVEAAQEGNEAAVEDCSADFSEHARKLVEVAGLACSMSDNDEGVKVVRYAASLIENLCPQVINSDRILAARQRSKVAKENIEVLRDELINQVRILTDAVDEITTVDDFLAVSENHILEDVNRCVAAVQEGDLGAVERTSAAIRGRSGRICNVVASEMDNYEPGLYTERVLEAIRLLSTGMMPNFAQKVDGVLDALASGKEDDVDENEFIEATRLVFDGVREIRHAVLLNRGLGDDDSDNEWANPEIVGGSETASNRPESTTAELVDEYPEISGITNAREAMKALPEEEREKVEEQIEVFREEKRKFDIEVSKWDDNGNDVIVLAKHMCMIMMEMTDFTRGKGPLQTTMAVINAAKRISEAGTKLDKLARQIADQCPESSTKKDLLAYLQRIALYCHQLNITSKVKADVQNVSGELIVSGLDSATSLIQAAKNLMNAVVLTVKASYVASTKYPSRMGGKPENPVVVWKMKVPEKKPLVRREAPEEVRAKVRRGSQRQKSNPVNDLSEFFGPVDDL
jgi:catenin alpha